MACGGYSDQLHRQMPIEEEDEFAYQREEEDQFAHQNKTPKFWKQMSCEDEFRKQVSSGFTDRFQRQLSFEADEYPHVDEAPKLWKRMSCGPEFQRQVSSGFTDRFRREVSCEGEGELQRQLSSSYTNRLQRQVTHDADEDTFPSRNMDGRKMDPDSIFHACAVKTTSEEASEVQDVMEFLFETGEEPTSRRNTTERGSSRRSSGDDRRTTERASFKRVSAAGRCTGSRMSSKPITSRDVAESQNTGAFSANDSGFSLTDEALFAHDITTTKVQHPCRLSKDRHQQLDQDDCREKEPCSDASRPTTAASETLTRTPWISPDESPAEDVFDVFSLEAAGEALSRDQCPRRQITCPTTPKPSKTCPRARQNFCN